MVLVTPGLNNRPEAMDPLAHTLRESGLDSLTVALRFGQEFEPDAIAADWVSSVACGYDQCRQRDPRAPLFSLAYSLGAVVTLAFLRRTPSATLDRLLLIAPPLALTGTAELVRLLTPLRRLGMALPSLAPEEVRARSSTTLADYHAMLLLIKELNEAPLSPNIAGAQTSVVLGTDDELVDEKGVRRWIDQRKLPWRTRTVSRGPTPHHLLLSEPRSGAAAWKELTSEMLGHFAVKPAPQ
jgi:hypothetical protein